MAYPKPVKYLTENSIHIQIQNITKTKYHIHGKILNLNKPDPLIKFIYIYLLTMN